MANLIERDKWEPGVYQLETTDPVMGGPDGIDNLQAKQLANRTLYLKKQIEHTQNSIPTVPVQSVNGKIGDVQLSAADFDALTEQQLLENFLPAQKQLNKNSAVYDVVDLVKFQQRPVFNNSGVITLGDYRYDLNNGGVVLRRADGLIIQKFTANYNESHGETGTVVSLPVTFPTVFYFAIAGDAYSGCHTTSAIPNSNSSVRIWGKTGNNYIQSSVQIIAIGR